MKVGILGGGLSGLTLANSLGGHEVEVLESYSRPGGLCRSFESGGFVGDYGGHVLFSKDSESLSFLVNALGDNCRRIRRENRILYKGSFCKYPFENDLASIPVQDRYECLYHFLFDRYPGGNNLEEWCYATFGKGISEKYLLPYSRKVWKSDTRELSTSWVERIPKPPKEDVIKSALGIPTEGYKHQLYFSYPLSGGIEALIRSLSSGVKITTDFRVTSVEREGDGWAVGSEKGDSRSYDRVISTIPVFALFDALKPGDAEISGLVKELRYNSLAVALVCLDRPRKHDFSALYVPDPDVIFHRICYMDYFSPHNSPEGRSSIVAEITAARGSELEGLSDTQVRDRVMEGLEKLGEVERGEVADVVVRRQKYGYVVNDLDYEARLARIHSYLDKIGLPFCGRFAEFRYLNMDACVRSARKTARELAGD